MYPYLETVVGSFEMYDVMTIIGTVVAVILQMIMLYRGTKKIRCVLFSALYGLYSWVGAYVGSFVRQTSYGRQIEGNIVENVINGEGKHYLGIVIVCAVLAIPCTYLLCYVLRIQKGEWSATKKIALNALAMGILTHHVFIRLGCFFRGCCYGKYYDGIWGIVIPNSPASYPVFPSQLLEVIISIILLILLAFMINKKKDVFGFTMIGYALNIIITENFMDQKGFGMIWGITIVQWWASALLLYGIGYCIVKKMSRRK